MPWIQIKLDVRPDHAEVIEDALLEAGSVSVTMVDAGDQPLYEPVIGTTPLWDVTRILGLLDAQANIDGIVAYLMASYATAYPDEPFPVYKIEILEDKDWERSWMDNFHPIQFGSRLWVVPSWCKIPDENAVNLMLDPGLAFGTGTHPTTSLCLQWLDGKDVQDKRVIDYGCGSGILGIAALLLGAKDMTGVDIDPQAILATDDNAQRNNVSSDKYDVYLPENAPSFAADVVLANILAGPLVELADTLTPLVKIGGDLVLSGLLEDQIGPIVEAYSPWFDFTPHAIDEGWVRLHAVRNR
jgi:ribosomal protein L11 methyltransferase